MHGVCEVLPSLGPHATEGILAASLGDCYPITFTFQACALVRGLIARFQNLLQPSKYYLRIPDQQPTRIADAVLTHYPHTLSSPFQGQAGSFGRLV